MKEVAPLSATNTNRILVEKQWGKNVDETFTIKSHIFFWSFHLIQILISVEDCGGPDPDRGHVIQMQRWRSNPMEIPKRRMMIFVTLTKDLPKLLFNYFNTEHLRPIIMHLNGEMVAQWLTCSPPLLTPRTVFRARVFGRCCVLFHGCLQTDRSLKSFVFFAAPRQPRRLPSGERIPQRRGEPPPIQSKLGLWPGKS